MTALASSLLAALPGGLVPTVGAGSAAPTTGGGFEGLLAGMMAGQGEGGALQPGLPTAFPQTKAQAALATNDSEPLDGAVPLDGPPASAQRVEALAGVTEIAIPGPAAKVLAPIGPDGAALPLTAPKAERQPAAPVSSAGSTTASPPTLPAAIAPVSPPGREMVQVADDAPAAVRTVTNAEPDAVPPTGRDRTPPRKTTADAARASPTPKATVQGSPVADATFRPVSLPLVAAVETEAPVEAEGDAPSATPAQIDAAPAFDASLSLFAAAGLTAVVRAVEAPVVDGEAPAAVAGPRRDRVSAFEAFRTTSGVAAPLAPTAAAVVPATPAAPRADLAEPAAFSTGRSAAPQTGTGAASMGALVRVATPNASSIPGLPTALTAPTGASDAPAIHTAAAPPLAPTLTATPATQVAVTAPELAAPVATPTVARTTMAPEADARRATSARTDRRQNAAAAAAPVAAGSPVLAPKGSVAPVEFAAPGLAEAAPDAMAIPVAVAETVETSEPVQPAAPAEVRPAALHTIATFDQAAPRGAPETVARLAADIVRKLEGQSTRFDLALDPHGLGRVDVSVEIDRDGKLTASLSFDSAQTAADLRGRSGELRHALEKAGFEVSDSGLSFDMSGQGAGFGQREAGEQNRTWNGRAFQRAQAGAEEADASLAAATTNPARRTSSGVDIRI